MGIPVVSESAVVDLVAVWFLQSKGIDTAPPEATSKLANALAGALTGGAGVMAGGIFEITRNQKKHQAMQEWTTWKQWALSHVEWTLFLDANRESVEAALQDLVNAESLKQEEKMARISKNKKRDRRNGLILISSPLWLPLFTLLLALPIQIFQYYKSGCFYDAACFEQWKIQQEGARNMNPTREQWGE